MIFTGLCSITFRKLSPRQIIDAVAQAGLAGIEWGGDVHCPHGDVAIAKQVGQMTRDAGLAVSSYGSYYRLGGPAGGKESPEFEAVLASAAAMEAPMIRVWAGSMGSVDADAAYRASVVADGQRVSAAAGDADIAIGLEYHAGSLTDTLESTQDLLAEIDRDNVSTYFQPPFGSTKADNLAAMRALGGRISNLHVFHWLVGRGDKIDHRPLAEGQDDWAEYLAQADALDGDRWAILEFVRDGELPAFVDDAATLRAWLAR